MLDISSSLLRLQNALKVSAGQGSTMIDVYLNAKFSHVGELSIQARLSWVLFGGVYFTDATQLTPLPVQPPKNYIGYLY